MTGPYYDDTERRLCASQGQLLEAQGFVPKRYGVSERYRSGMEVVAEKSG